MVEIAGLSYDVFEPINLNMDNSRRQSCVFRASATFSNTRSTPESALVYRFQSLVDAEKYMSVLASLRPSSFTPMFLSTKNTTTWDIVGKLETGDSFETWCMKNATCFWKFPSKGGHGISLGDAAVDIFRQISFKLKAYHDQCLGHGNLKNGIMILQDNKVVLINESLDRYCWERGHLDAIRDDFQDFRFLVQKAAELVNKQLRIRHVNSPSFNRFFDIYDQFMNYSNSFEDLRSFGFYLRNSPLFLDSSGAYMLYKKVLDLFERDQSRFMKLAQLAKGRTSLQQWWVRPQGQPQHFELLRIMSYKNQALMYEAPFGSIMMYRNSLGHIRANQVKRFAQHIFTDGDTMEILREYAPEVIPHWYSAMFTGLADRPNSCVGLYGSSLDIFLGSPPTALH